ncbi:Tfp pilus assembly protein PilN [Sterolibacterium denitrificans]|uniref:Tfp pilus assembly protein PilN n=1 Tax=Sterolibacterium denitrificans TaxID=157592 RepID=A0A7Z7MV93_9PROT|nr:PilN domain-containing protein [Sterolibacterium denitrificans]SMB26486.1 Tfp pilus assembly protein PilN [Sterolibacterium denitrificans]
MIRINLLPHREEKRAARRRQFFALLGAIAILAGLIWFMGYGVINGYISSQDDKNRFLKSEIAALDKDIEAIKHLKEQTDALLSRKRIIESLQANRAETVHLFNELARQMPEGTYLKSIKQKGDKVTLVGYAQSNSRVSSMMRNLEASPLLERPGLVEIQSVTVGSRRLSQFNMNVYFTRQQTTAEDDVKENKKLKKGKKS